MPLDKTCCYILVAEPRDWRPELLIKPCAFPASYVLLDEHFNETPFVYCSGHVDPLIHHQKVDEPFDLIIGKISTGQIIAAPCFGRTEKWGCIGRAEWELLSDDLRVIRSCRRCLVYALCLIDSDVLVRRMNDVPYVELPPEPEP